MVVLATTRRACASRARRGVQFAQGRAFEFCAIYRVSWAGEKSYGWVTSLLQSPQPVYEFTCCRSQDNRVGITVGGSEELRPTHAQPTSSDPCCSCALPAGRHPSSLAVMRAS